MDRIDEPDANRLVGADDPAGEDELLGDTKAADARESLRPAPTRKDSEVHLGLPELRARRGVTHVARERELAPAAERKPVDGRDRRLRHRLEQASGLVPESAPLLRLVDVEAAHVLDVRSGDECLLPRAGHDHRARRLVAGELAQPVTQLRERRHVKRVHGLRTVDRDERDRVFPLDVDQTGTLPLRKSTISLVGAPGVKTSATPRCFSSSESSRGIVPPTTTRTSSAPFAFNPSRMRGTSVMCAPDRIEIPTASASSWIAVSTICSGVWCSPV